MISGGKVALEKDHDNSVDIRFGDNLEEIRKIPSKSIDLVYIDPPFFTGKNWGDFNDTWNGMDEYMNFMRPRLKEIHRVLKPTGSIYVHSDHHASKYLGMLCDQIFGISNFRNEIIWKRTDAKGNARKSMNVVTDSIFLYSKTGDNVFNVQTVEKPTKRQIRDYKFDEKRQKYYKLNDLTVPGGTKNNFEWRGTRPKSRSWKYPEKKLDEMLARGEIKTRENGSPLQAGHIQWFDEIPFKAVDNLWTDINRIGNTSKERLDYATQKPEKLIERIIKMSSIEGDVVLDIFAGSGTTCAVASRLGRRSICIDNNPRAFKIMEERLK
jgi:DNA modification methylase